MSKKKKIEAAIQREIDKLREIDEQFAAIQKKFDKYKVLAQEAQLLKTDRKTVTSSGFNEQVAKPMLAAYEAFVCVKQSAAQFIPAEELHEIQTHAVDESVLPHAPAG